MKKNLQIILMGWEWDRLIYGLKESPPKKAILICSSDKGQQSQWSGVTKKITNNLISKIKEIIDTEIHYVDYYDFDDCLFTLVKIIEKNINEYDAIGINISSGNKILVTASILVSQYYPIEIFYVIPEQYNVNDDRPFLTSGAKGIVKLPTFDIKELVVPTKKQGEIFNEIGYDKINFSDLVKKYSESRKIELDKRKMEKMKSLFFYHLKNLKEKKLVELEIKNRQLLISLTNTGKFIFKIMEMKHVSKKISS
ncbi:MAG: hypothetical protein KKB03_04100 [Nanoarchaeota archaeon]|nr:hypothetical protein [Nanoarchaeota archaeon]MBU1134890.1 hypothetical protein [Nanoarchaeota archaeon]MBU2520396.1 hypothetical protein [Nanoarchaeota archaeon]